MDELEDFQFAEEIVSQEIVSWEGISINNVESLKGAEDYSKTSFFKGLYGLDSQIRMLNNVLYHAIRTGGRLLSHSVLVGPPACGKSSVMSAVCELVGEACVLRIDATSTTAAGLQTLLLHDLPVIPPIILLEEIEKSDVQNLMLYLGMLDHRQEIRKVTSRGAFRRRINSLVIATANDEDKFEKMAAGALSSRFSSKIYFPRPNRETLQMILCRHAEDYDIVGAPIHDVLQYSETYNVSDPRVLCSMLLQSNLDDVKKNSSMKTSSRKTVRKKTDVDELNALIAGA